MKVCHIVGAGDMGGARISVAAGDFLIAADAGYLAVQAQSLKPDLVVGDFDSLGDAPKGENVVRHPVMKDDTDMLLAVKLGMENGYDSFCIYGALGGRLDHTLANMQVLQFIAERGGRGFIIGDTCVTAVHNGEIAFRDNARGVISVFCMGAPAEGVTLEGLLYTLHEYTLHSDVPIGVSNEFTGKPSHVSVKNGTLVVTFGDLDYCEWGR